MIETLSSRVLPSLSPRKAVLITVSILVGVVLLSSVYSSHMWVPSTTASAGTPSYSLTTSDDFIVSGNIWRPIANTVTKSHRVHADLVEETNDRDQVMQRFPQAIIIGVKKGGTRALIDMLRSHPQIKSATGEVHFFDREENFGKGIKWYINKMPFTTQNQVTIEKSPSYFVIPDVPQRMHTLSLDLKLILIVRNPIDRAVSDYCQLYNPERSSKNLPFEELVLSNNQVNGAVSVITVSTYDVHMARWLKYFHLEQIHIVDGDALIQNPAPEVIKVERFLGVTQFFHEDMFYYNASKGFYCWKVSRRSKEVPHCLGSGKGRQHPNISHDAMQLLRNFFKPHNQRFYELVERSFSWDDS